MSLTFSIIVPSFNQSNYIEFTCLNLAELKSKVAIYNYKIEVLLFDNCSDSQTRAIIDKYSPLFDVKVIEKDKGQYDAINKGIQKCTGDYWTWLNTDDLIDIDGFIKMAEILKSNKAIDYIYGGVSYIDEAGNYIKTVDAFELTLKKLSSVEPAIFQPGSFFKKSFTDKMGLLSAYSCCFDYEYILRLLKNNAIFYFCSFPLSKFRYYSNSKTGSNTVQFIKEQLIISTQYGRKWYHYLTVFSKLRLIKHFLFPKR